MTFPWSSTSKNYSVWILLSIDRAEISVSNAPSITSAEIFTKAAARGDETPSEELPIGALLARASGARGYPAKPPGIPESSNI